MEAMIYCRVSTIMQEEKESLQYQIKKCQDYCSLQGYEVKRVITDVESGSKDDREGFLELQSEIKNKTFDVLVVFETSRVSRDLASLAFFVKKLRENEIGFMSISQPELNTTTPGGTFFFHLQASFAEYERVQIAQRVKSSLEQRAKEGRFVGGTTPTGYKNIDKKLVPDPEGVELVNEIFDYYVETQSLAACGKRFGKHIESVRWILANEVYIGKKRYNQKTKIPNTNVIKRNERYDLYEGQHEGIVSEEKFYLVQELLASNRKTRSRDKDYLLSGFLKCSCGTRMYGSVQKSRGKSYYYYKCNRKKCSKKIQIQKTDNLFLEKLYNSTILEELNEIEARKTHSEERFKKIEKKISKHKKEKERLIRSMTKGIISEEEYISLAEKMEGENKVLIAEKNRLISEDSDCGRERTNNAELFKEVMANLDPTDVPDARNILNLIIKKIKVRNLDELSLSLEFKF